MEYFWDTRFRNEEYVYGIAPNKYFEKTLKELNLNGNILFPAEGEGRNAVFAATKGLNVVAFDLSIEGKKKALKLATDNNVDIKYLVGEFETLGFEESSFDAIVLVFAHFHPSIRQNLHTSFAKLLKKGGVLILEGFSKNNFKMENNNGPKNIDLLFSTEMISSDFSEIETINLSEELVELNEGDHHTGLSSVVRFVGKKI